jgi:hypothetical protein
MPRRAAWPVPTMIAVGVASPSAHGQAMSSTAMACARAVAGVAAGEQPAAEGQPGDAADAGTKRAEMRSASFCTGSLLPCAWSTRRTIPASTVSRRRR